LIAEDQLIAEGLRKLLECEFESILIVGNERELLYAVAGYSPDVVILDIDIALLNGIEAMRRFSKISPATTVVIVTAHTDRRYIVDLFGAGASGYVLKRCAVSELVTAIRRVLEGQTYVTPLMADYSVPTAKESAQRLTVRQREVLQLIAKGCTAKKIANALNRSVKTAVFHKTAIMDRLGLRTTAELTRYALQHGIISGASEGGPPPFHPASGNEGDQGDCGALAHAVGNN
jgi:DNA-binding NarL/FixJ family response regulator